MITTKWIEVNLVDICKNINTTSKNLEEEGIERYVGLEHLEPESLVISTWGLVKNGATSFKKLFYPGQILFGKRRSYQKKAAVADFKGVCSGDILVLEAKEDIIIPQLLPYIIQNDRFFDYAVGTSSGSLSPRTSWKHLSSYKVRIPKEKKDQANIYDKLTQIEQAVINKKKLIIDTKKYHRILINELLNNGIKQSTFKNTELGEIPIDWETFNLKDIGSFSKGKGIAKKDVVSTGLPCVRYGEIYTTYDYKIDKTVSFIKEIDRLKTVEGKKGDILFTGSGETPEDIGKSITINSDESIFVGGDIVIFTPHKPVESLFLSYQLNHSRIRKKITSLAQGQSIYHIYANHLENIKVLLPPIEEQRKIAEIISGIDNQIKAYGEEVLSIINIKKTLQEQLL